MKVYDKPDRSVAILWECESLPEYIFAAFDNNRVCGIYEDKPGGLAVPVKQDGRWRPYIPNNPEPWPPCKLMPRRCWATIKEDGTRALFLCLPNEMDGISFRCIDSRDFLSALWASEKCLTNITWIDPEQEAVEVQS
jgi:hypothetical protein